MMQGTSHPMMELGFVVLQNAWNDELRDERETCRVHDEDDDNDEVVDVSGRDGCLTRLSSNH